MFLKNCWYCAGWDSQVTQGKDSLVAQKIAGKRVVLYRKPGRGLVAMEDLFPEGFLCDANFDITATLPLNWIPHFRVFTAGTATEGESDGQLVMNSWSCQAITPRDEGSVDCYYSWGVSKDTDQPGLSGLPR